MFYKYTIVVSEFLLMTSSIYGAPITAVIFFRLLTNWFAQNNIDKTGRYLQMCISVPFRFVQLLMSYNWKCVYKRRVIFAVDGLIPIWWPFNIFFCFQDTMPVDVAWVGLSVIFYSGWQSRNPAKIFQQNSGKTFLHSFKAIL